MKSFSTIIYILTLSVLITNSKELKTNHSNITGKIAYHNGAPVTDALVGISTINRQVSTDDKGNYYLSNIPYGSYVIEVLTLEGEYSKVEVNCLNAKTELSLTLNIREVVKVDEVVVVGKPEGLKIKDKGFAMSLVDTKKESLSSLQATELLNRASGVKLRQSGGMGSDVQYNINGLTGSSIRIFINGIPMRNYGSSFSLSSIPPSMIDRIEVYKGVVPVHLAEDALGGAVNVVLKQSTLNNLTTSYSYGSFNTHKWDINGNYRNEKSGFTAGGSAFYNYTDNNYKVWGDQVYVTDPLTGKKEFVVAERFHDSYQSAGVNLNIGFTQKSWADRLMIGLLYSDMKKDIQNGATMDVVYGNRTASQNTKMVSLAYDKGDIFDKLNVSAFASYSFGVSGIVDTTADMYNWWGDILRDADGNPFEWNKGGGEAGRRTLAKNIEQNIAGKMNLSYSFLTNHTVSANVLYDRFVRDVDDPLLPTAEQLLTDTRFLTKNIISTSYETQLINSRLKISVFYKHYMQRVKLTDPFLDGVVLVKQDIDRTTSQGGFGGVASFSLTPQIQFVFSGERALRLPDNNELLGNVANNIEASYDLKPESSINFNLGVVFGDYKWGHHTIMSDVNLFYRDIKDMIQRGLTNLTDEMYGYENLGKVLSKGFDIDLRYNYKKKLFVDVSLSNFNARYNLQYNEHGDEYVYYGDRLRNAPYLTANGNVSYVKEDLFLKGSKFSINYNLGYVHEFFRNWESLGGAGKAIIPMQLIHDIGLVYTFPKNKISLGFDAKNITNEQVFDNWALQKPGRAFFVKLTYNIL